jgi:hypothetical protein
MPWYRVTFDLDNDQPPGIEPQIAVAVRVQQAYNALGCPAGFAVYDFIDYESKLYFFFFAPVAAQHFEDFIASNRHEVWNQPLPTEAHLTIGDAAAADDLPKREAKSNGDSNA